MPHVCGKAGQRRCVDDACIQSSEEPYGVENRLTQMPLTGSKLCAVDAGGGISENGGDGLFQIATRLRQYFGNAADVGGIRIAGDEMLDQPQRHKGSNVRDTALQGLESFDGAQRHIEIAGGGAGLDVHAQ